MRADNDGFLKRRQKAVADEFLVCREIYNPNDFTIVFERDRARDVYIMTAAIPLGPLTLTCKPGEWLFLPHGFYIPKASNGCELISVVQNFGDQMGIGNKYPSRPEVKLR